MQKQIFRDADREITRDEYKRLVQEARERGMLIDASCGRKTKAVLVMDTDHVVLSGLAPETIAHRAGVELEQEPEEE